MAVGKGGLASVPSSIAAGSLDRLKAASSCVESSLV